ncbi:UvrB/UvrC motif-containing protein [Virgibacillus alimentarius]|uniref:Protein arginine kinase activator n=1 Tax=Virgibacillus alimentarius TaxID=698769 RepID=A0ABS4S990_9BACI|nr:MULTISPECIES: UvrB/UvrC motif-containing protein [Virgibacillus]MBP2258066.1 protein arginine kinase activator [Virgibacillus alimentarius]HLR65866.1 UvrB/UvrC motif-containing protein [Virgibacillus sp.]
MECQECHKRPASLHFSQTVNGNKTEVYVCEVCAKEKGYMTYPEEGYSLHDLLSDLFNFDAAQIGSHNKTFQQTTELQCPECKMNFSSFKRTGKFGCAQCYHTFSKHIDPIFRRVHSGNTKHSGKIPKRKGGNLHTKKQIEQHKQEIQQLIENEAFEEAAIVRDKIKELERQIHHSEEVDDS